jgi:2-(1,2-epoxy-1,2-dihydrophenyl)acetyl-CoA isomerase
MTDVVTYEITDGVAHIVLNRPEVASAIDLDLSAALLAAVSRAAADADVRSLLLSGAGRRFCAGGDVNSFADAPDPAEHLRRLAIAADEAVRALADVGKPTVVDVHGAVAGAGLALMLSCDIVIADPTTKFVFAYPSIGLTPDCGVSYLLPRAIGQQRALSFALLGSPLAAPVALEWGMVTEVADEARARARAVARQLADGPAVAFARTRRLLRAGWEASRFDVGRAEAECISELVAGVDAQSRIASFLGR